jgi:hypothetical protein
MRDVMTRVTIGGAPSYRHVDGTRTALEPPGSQTFWAEHASGPGSQQLTWRAEPGRWALAILNESGEPGVNVSAQAAFRAGSLLPIAIGLVIGGLVLAAVATVLVVVGLSRREAGRPGSAAFGGPYPRQDLAARAAHAHPLVLEGRLEPNLSRGLWLVKWFLAIPHYFVLFFLWAAVGVMTVVAWFAILFTARYPRSLFEFNVGVLRWTWRVAHYSGTGGLGTDRYPPFTLDELPDDAAHLSVDYPERLSRGLIFVKWLLLLPHWIVIAVIAGTQSRTDDHGLQVGGWPGILALITLVAGIVLLATGTANQGLFDVIVGLNRWTYRVAVYALLMTDVYPPFRYDGGADEPVLGPPPGPGAPGLAPPPPAPGAQPVDLPAPDLPATVPTAPVPAAPVPSAPGSRVSTRPEQQRISP